jgi:hypothetical protein
MEGCHHPALQSIIPISSPISPIFEEKGKGRVKATPVTQSMSPLSPIPGVGAVLCVSLSLVFA